MKRAQLGQPRLNQAGLPSWALFLSRVFPFFVSAVFFLSAFFALFSPLPLLALAMDRGSFRGPRWLVAAFLSNLILVGALGGVTAAALYAVVVGVPTLALPILVQKKLRIEWVVSSVLGAMLLGFLVAVGVGAVAHQGWQGGLTVRPPVLMDWAKHQVSETLKSASDLVLQSAPTDLTQQMEARVAVQEWRDQVLQELPSAGVIAFLILTWLCLVWTLRLARAEGSGIRIKMILPPGGLLGWRAPEYWVWPVILAGAGTLWLSGPAGTVALNVLRILLAVSVLQGVAVVAVAMRRLGVSPGFRALLWLAAFFFGIPLVLAVGFFDLWFDFRKRFRQT